MFAEAVGESQKGIEAGRDAAADTSNSFIEFYEIQANGAINVVNDASKIVGAPAIEKFEITGGWWQKNGRKEVGEITSTVAASVMSGNLGAAGKAINIADTAVSSAEAIVGEDMRTGAELSTTQRIIQGVGAAVSTPSASKDALAAAETAITHTSKAAGKGTELASEFAERMRNARLNTAFGQPQLATANSAPTTVSKTTSRVPGQTADDLNVKMSASGSSSASSLKYDAAKRTDAELQTDLDATPRVGETAIEAQTRVEFATGEIAMRRVDKVYDELGENAPKIDIDLNDARNSRAHTIERHGEDIEMPRDPSKKTVEGRIYGDAPWNVEASFSYKWKDKAVMNNTINEYLQKNWEVVRSDLALEGRHEATFDAGKAVGEGYFNKGQMGTGARQAVYHQTSNVKITIELVPGSSPAEMFIVRAFPNGSGR